MVPYGRAVGRNAVRVQLQIAVYRWTQVESRGERTKLTILAWPAAAAAARQTCPLAHAACIQTARVPLKHPSRSPIPWLDWLLLVPPRFTGTNKQRDISGDRIQSAQLSLDSPSIIFNNQQPAPPTQPSLALSPPAPAPTDTHTGVTSSSSPRRWIHSCQGWTPPAGCTTSTAVPIQQPHWGRGGPL